MLSITIRYSSKSDGGYDFDSFSLSFFVVVLVNKGAKQHNTHKPRYFAAVCCFKKGKKCWTTTTTTMFILKQLLVYRQYYSTKNSSDALGVMSGWNSGLGPVRDENEDYRANMHPD
jgi:hypothetical protein